MSSNEPAAIFGIDLGTTFSCIAYVDEYGKSVVIPNSEGDLTTPSVVLFEGTTRVVGKEAKNSAMLNVDRVVEMVKRQMGDPAWFFEYEDKQYTAEEISSYILKKLSDDAAAQFGRPVTDVVITCPAYFGIAQREATARAGELAGLSVREIINEPTAAAIDFGLQNEGDRVVLVYDLGGGTFDITVIHIESGAINVIATGGDHNLGGRDWDEEIVRHLAQQWMERTGSADDPLDNPATLQDLWQRAENAKRALSARAETRVTVAHDGKQVGVVLTREQFDDLTANLLERTIEFAKSTWATAQAAGVATFDQLLLVGGSTRMPQVKARLSREFGIEPRMHDPDQAVAKGAATYGHKLLLGDKIATWIAGQEGIPPQEVNLDAIGTTTKDAAMAAVAAEGGYRLPAVKQLVDTKITNVTSHSFGIIAIDPQMAPHAEFISNLVLLNDALPAERTRRYGTEVAGQETVVLRIVENNTPADREDKAEYGQEVARATLELPPDLPEGAPIDITFKLDCQGRLHVIGREPSSGRAIETSVETGGRSEAEIRAAKERSANVVVSG